MRSSWSPPPRRSAGSIKPLKPTRTRGQIVTDRIVTALVLALWVAAVLAIASIVSGS